eukprot:3016662-Pleurochrysis_carterae.AAC.1
MNSFSSGLPMVNPSRAALLLALEGLIESSVFFFTNAAEAAAEAVTGLSELIPNNPSTSQPPQPPGVAPAAPPPAASDTD